MTIKTAKRAKKRAIGALPRSLTDYYRHSMHLAFEELVEGTLPGTVGRFKASYQASQFLSKYADPDPKSALNRAIAAVEKWLAVEERNSRTNIRIQVDEATFTGGFTSTDVVVLARKYIRECIGDEPPANLADYGEFTNGASTRVRRSPTAISHKFVGQAHVTSGALPFFEDYLLENEGFLELWSRMEASGFSIVPGSVMFTVPKNSDIDRVACKEPEINMFLQRACGNVIRRRLLRSGVNLNDQSINRGLAKRASTMKGLKAYLDLATIDLSSASDSVTTSLVVELLPPAWFVTLNALRSHEVYIPKFGDVGGYSKTLDMFSSMGNGFTFELESLLFWALARSFCTLAKIRGRISVYGDDIILPRLAAPRFAKVLSWFGFKVNTSKSFWTGKFRESCGGHYYFGYDVTPFYLRGPLKDQRDLINQLNQLREWVTRDSLNGLWTYINEEDMKYASRLADLWNVYASYIYDVVKGGRDLESNSSLVSPDRPRKRFVARSKTVWCDPDGAYLHWLHARERVLDVVTSRVKVQEDLILAPNPSATGIPATWFFLQELDGVDLTCAEHSDVDLN